MTLRDDAKEWAQDWIDTADGQSTSRRHRNLCEQFLAMDAELTAEKAKTAKLRDACLLVDRYFDALDGVNDCNVDLCEKTARYGVDKALKDTANDQ